MGYKLKRIMMWVENTTRGLPSTYQEVEYIQSSGTQYIDTGIAIKDGFKIICNTEFVSWGTYMALGGYLGQSGGTYYRLYGGANAGKWVYGFLGYYSDDLGNSLLNTKYELELQIKSGDNYFKVNGTTMASRTQTFSTSLTGNIGVLAGYADDVSGKWNKWSAKMYDYKIRDNGGTLIRDFVPCYRKSDNVIGMYDLVNNQFYTNSGTGTFTKGADIPDMVEKQVRPSGGGGWQPGANTVLYCPLKDDILDHSGNHTMTMTTSTYGTVAKDSTGFYYFNGGYISSEAYSGPIIAGTLSTWVKKSSSKSGGDSRYTWSVSAHYSGSSPYHCGLAFNYGGYGGQNGEFHAGATSGTSGKSISGPTMGSWELWTMTYDNTVGAKFYRNGVYEDSFSNTNNLRNDSLPTFIGATNPYTDQYLDGYLSDVIIEDKARTAQEITDYYNLTKSNYGL